MRCPSCGAEIADSGATACPICGRVLPAAAPGQAPQTAAYPVSAPPIPSAAPQDSAASPAEAAMSEPPAPPIPPADGSQASPSPSPTTYPTYPAYTPYGYGQMALPSVPLAPGQAAPPSVPFMGSQPVPPSYPQSYGPPSQGFAPPSQGFAPYPPGYGPYPQPMPIAQPRKGRVGLVLAIVAAVVVVCALLSVGFAAVLAVVPSRQVSTSTSGVRSTATTATEATATGTRSENVIFHDDFTSPSSGWANDSHCAYGAGGYHIPDGYICYAPTGKAGDVVVTADMKQVAGETTWFYGVVLRRASTGNFYAFLIDSNGKWEFTKYVNDQGTTLLPYVPNAAIHTGLNADNTLKVRAVGSHFDFFVNDTQVGQFDDATFSTGACGVVGSHEGGVEVVVTQFTLALVN